MELKNTDMVFPDKELFIDSVTQLRTKGAFAKPEKTKQKKIITKLSKKKFVFLVCQCVSRNF